MLTFLGLAKFKMTFFSDYSITDNILVKSQWYRSCITQLHLIYKGGGSMDTNSFRGIAASSCFSKLFCKILFDRLDKYLDDNSMIDSEQTGFRKHCRTTNHILTIKTFIDKAFKL